MLRNVTLRIPEALEGQRLDRVVLVAVPTVSRSAVAQAFSDQGVTIDGHPAAKGDRATAGTDLHIGSLPERTDERAQPAAGPLDILYQDSELLAFNKPGGQDCHPLTPGETGTLVNAMLARYPEMAGVGGDPMTPALLHRIDAGTSGLVLAARTQPAFETVRKQFAAQEVTKTYLALVEGRVDSPGGVAGFLAHTPGDRGRMRVVTLLTAPKGERPLRAETFFRPVRTLTTHTLLEITIRTGVTHQIRCQLASIGHPIHGDRVYGARGIFPENPRRHFLHSAAASLLHPATEQPLELHAALSDDLVRCLRSLE